MTKNVNSYRIGKQIKLVALAALFLAPFWAWGQTDYSGVYYIASDNSANGHPGSEYNSGAPASNYYLVPAANPQQLPSCIDAYYSPNHETQNGDPEKPFLATYKTNKDLNSIWLVVESGESGYYFVIHALSGKYVIHEPPLPNDNDRRKAMHLQAIDNDDYNPSTNSYFKFKITNQGSGIKIEPKNRTGYYWNPAGQNSDNYYGTGSTLYHNGLVGLYNNAAQNSIWHFEDASSAADLTPIISDVDGLTNTFSIISPAAAFSTIHYTTDGTTTPDVNTGTATNSGSPISITGNWTVQAVGVFGNFVTPLAGPKNLGPAPCPTPVITVSNSTATITCPLAGASIYYTTDGTPATTSSTPYNGPFSTVDVEVIRAIATSPGYLVSNEAFYYPFVEVSSSSAMTNMNGRYILLEGFTSLAPIGTAEAPFRGHIDGGYNAFALNGHALIGMAEDAVIKNVVVSSVTYSGSGNVGAIVNTAKGGTKIYNCGIQGGSVSGGTNTGGLVGLIQAGSSVRVVNCYNFANVSGSSYAAGIVGKNEGTVASNGTVGNVRIALCMMYGNVTGATNISPVYGGNHVDNVLNFTEYNYWRYRSGLQYTALNDQLPIEEDEYLKRFPFFRHILNSHREMAAFFLFGGASCNDMAEIADADIAEIGHWVLKKDVAAYPIIEPWPTGTQTTQTSTNNNLPSTTDDYAGKLLTELGTNGHLSVSVIVDGNTYSISLPITDMDTLNYDFTWGKVVLPFANEFVVNTDYSKICTGWKITGITGGTAGTFEHYNVSDRHCTTKDLYNTTGFIFAQGGNYVVPYGVTGIEITANFATAYYLCDENYEIAYSGNRTANDDAGYIGRTGLAGSTPDTYHNRQVYHTLGAALNAMSSSGSTHEQAVVLIGNYHHDDVTLSNSQKTKGCTIMSIDADNNQEPDYAWYSNHTQNRPEVQPTRFDFVALIPLGMSSHLHGSVHYPNIPIWKPHGWFEITETSFTRAAQFEIESNKFNTSDNDPRNYRCIINGGYFTQMVRSRNAACTKLSYYQIGGKAFIKEFYPGNHSQNSHANTLVPINVTGGEIEQCFMTGYGKGKAYGTDIYFWCAGGRIHKFLGAYMEPPVETSNNDESNPGTVNLTAKIDHARIYRFFGGGTTSKARITGDIKVTIDNSFVDFYCGGPEFGDMVTGDNGKTVETTADHTTFREYYGAGFGGTAVSYTNDKDETLNFNNTSILPAGQTDLAYPSDYFGSCYLNNSSSVGRLDYKAGYGIGNCYKYEYIMHSRGHATVARFYTGYASFSLAKTGSVTNTLTNCTVERSFYGGGCQGTVDGTVTSTLTDCTIGRSAFGGGYKAVSNEVEVYSATQTNPLSTYYGEGSVFSDFGPIPPSSETYTWKQGTQQQQNMADATNHIFYTSKDITLIDLGNVTGDITITLKGNTTVNGNVFGGGNESKSLANTLVEILEHTKVLGNIYGGGNMAEVRGDTKVVVNGQGGTGNNSDTHTDDSPTNN